MTRPWSLFEDVGVIATDTTAGPPKVRRGRAFAGHAGWGPGQLDAELKREDWIVERAVREDAFTFRTGGAVVRGADPQGRELRAGGPDASGSVGQRDRGARPASGVRLGAMKLVRPGEEHDVPRGVVGGAEISQATAGAHNIYMGRFRVPAGARSLPHYHEGCESTLYMSAAPSSSAGATASRRSCAWNLRTCSTCRPG